LKIKTQFITSLTIIIIIMGLTIASLLAKDIKKFLYIEIDEKAKIIINYLQGVIWDPLLKKDKLNLIMYIRKISKTPGVLYINIVSHNDTIIASTSQEFIDKQMEKIFLEIKQQRTIHKVKINKKEYYSIDYYDDIIVKNKEKDVLIGKIYLGFDKRYIDNKINTIYVKSITIAILSILFAIFIIVLLTNKIMEPLQKLIKGAEILAEGNLRHKIKVNVKNEFQILANSFNEMSEKLFNYYEGILNAFIIAIDTKDKYTPIHSKRVAKYAVKLAQELKLTDKQIENIRLAGLLKDVGNIGVEREILQKKEILTADDILKIQKHPKISARILEHIEALKDVIPIILQHHERYDGKGYPEGLKANEILLEARILAIADAYDAMVTKREHKDALSQDEAIYELRSNKNKQFDPELTEVFISIINKEGGK